MKSLHAHAVIIVKLQTIIVIVNIRAIKINPYKFPDEYYFKLMLKKLNFP